ncbi:MAG: flagellar hook capping protein [Firmicutes bacterium]|nr:flagellar hook capping protein [Bacillota bacterium]
MTTVYGANTIGTMNTTAESKRKTGAMQELGKDAFLQLLVTQLRYQDPLNPQDNGAFIAQMAQFSALEQMQNLNESMNQLLKLQSDARLKAPGYLGLQVTVKGFDNHLVSGTVTAVEFSGNEPWLVVNGAAYPLANVVKVAQGAEAGED